MPGRRRRSSVRSSAWSASSAAPKPSSGRAPARRKTSIGRIGDRRHGFSRPAPSIHPDGRTARSRAFPPGPRPPAGRGAGANEPPLAFLRGEVSNDHPFVNQQVLYTIYLYSRIEVSAVNPLSSPDLNGFWARDVALPERLPTEIVALGDLRYGRVPLLR